MTIVLRVARATVHHIGRRGAFLLFLATVDLASGYGMAFPTPAARASQTYAYLAGLMPLRLWAMLWIVTGLICLVQAFMRHDRLAYTLATLTKILFGMIFLLAWVAGSADRGYITAAIWLSFAGITLMIAGWPEAQQ